MNIKITIGVILYNDATAKYLPYFFDSLERQSFSDFNLLVFDHSDQKDNRNYKFVEDKISQEKLKIKYNFTGANLGFAAAFNQMINRAIAAGSDYFVAINPDLIMEEDCLKNLSQTIEADHNLGSLSPKLRRWDFKNNNKTDYIDSCGIELNAGLSFIDVGQGQIDTGQFDHRNIIGPTGALAMYRLDALQQVSEDGKYFDELMFMYKEDCDLAYRLFLAGYKSQLVPEAVAYHDRTVAAKGESTWRIALNRKNKGRQAKRWSFLHQHIIFVKYWRLQSFREKLAIIYYEIKILGFVLLFEQFLLKEYLNLFKLRRKIKVY